MKNLKKNILLSFILLLVSSISATNLYWVGGTGSWNQAIHWSLTTGGVQLFLLQMMMFISIKIHFQQIIKP